MKKSKNPPSSFCLGKVGHKDKLSAIIAMRKAKNKQMNTYTCKRCGKWHIGRSNKEHKIQARLTQLLGPDPALKNI